MAIRLGEAAARLADDMACQSGLVLSAAGVAVASQRYNSSISSAAAASCNFKFPLRKSGTACRWSSPGGLTVADNVSFPLRFNIIAGSNKRIPSIRCALTPELKTTLDNVVSSHKVVLFMKGSKEFPQCGFSNTVVQILNSLDVPFETINILENEILRQGLKEYSNWPTFPQLYIEGEFFGGCDITVEAYQSGQLQELVEKAMCT